MVVVLHGAAGGWDEAAIAVVALVVLWLAVKLAGRKPANENEEQDETRTEGGGLEHDDVDLAPEALAVSDQEEQSSPAHPSPTKRG